ncbi:MAG TPA: hypothetical protein VGK67_35100 [Myxococcales bacterium]|jgi:hypothetical protein
MALRHLAAASIVVLLAASGAARADMFSPGELATPHAHLEGLKNCTSCHVEGQQLSAERCLSCHKELGARIAAGKGFHGRMAEKDRACETCHPEHRGRAAQLVEWPPSKKGFDHGKTGFALAGKHAGVDCDQCHDKRRVADPAVRAMLEKNPASRSMLGLPTRCNGCHFDEHRGQTGSDCDRCHDESHFKPPKHFEHEKTAFPLEGKHAGVACDKCHPRDEDLKTAKDAFPAPKAPTFLRFKTLAHAACTDCHQDPHRSRFGPNCVSCHTPDGWKTVRNLEKERGFHEKTRFPLRGAHAAAACAACHGKPPRFKGVAFARCGDCHADAHLGQLADPSTGSGQGAKAPGRGPDCSRCHDLVAFKPARFELEDHQSATVAFRLEGAHRAVACALCHKQDPKLAEKVPAATRQKLRTQRRPDRFSFARFDVKAGRCEDCHADPHAGQMASPQGCAGCHSTQGFSPPRFDHQKDTRFPLAGKHQGVACGRCHRKESGPSGRVQTRYKPLDVACDACHADPHAAQFAGPSGRTDCARCHSVDGYQPARFEHVPPATTFALAGKHTQVACEKCHPEVEVGSGLKARRYKPLGHACQDCHEDFHQGAFAGREFLSANGPGRPALPADGQTHCEACHTVEGYAGAAIAHERTGFPLTARHAKAACKDCHARGFGQALPKNCAGCHRDAHQGQLGQRCEGCHETESWRSRFGAEAHRRTNFPLSGRHAFVPCEECHLDSRDRGFGRQTLACYDCHQADYLKTSVTLFDHVAAGTGTSCSDCHDPARFSPARFAAHDACFEISAGPHSGIRCLDCHTRLTGVTVTGACFSRTAACTNCHEHTCAQTDRRHDGVQGYQCKDRKCYECHRFSQGG